MRLTKKWYDEYEYSYIEISEEYKKKEVEKTLPLKIPQECPRKQGMARRK